MNSMKLIYHIQLEFSISGNHAMSRKAQLHLRIIRKPAQDLSRKWHCTMIDILCTILVTKPVKSEIGAPKAYVTTHNSGGPSAFHPFVRYKSLSSGECLNRI